MDKRFDVTALPLNMRTKIMVSLSPKVTNGSVCWEWTGAQISTGYGSRGNGRGASELTHRAAYELLVAGIPAGLTIDHLCFNRICVNTDHMEVVTNAENNRRKNERQTHCKQGHPLSGDNLRVVVRRKTGWRYRTCITCVRHWGSTSERAARAAGRRPTKKVAA